MVDPTSVVKGTDWGYTNWYGDVNDRKESGDWGIDLGYDHGAAPPVAASELSPKERALVERLQEMEKRLGAIDAANTEQTRQLTALETKNTGIESQLGEVKKSVEEVKELPKQERKHWEAMFGTLLTRFGIAAVVLLLLRFMSSIYRYHTRMAAFYDAKADVFEACGGGDVHAMEKLSHLLTPSGVDFHETADTLMEHAVDLAKKASAS